MLPCNSQAQANFTRISGPDDQSVPVPTFVGTMGQQDAGALQVLLSYLKAVNVASWQGMQASGTLTDKAGNEDQATLTVLGGSQFRLDVQTPNGERSTRINGTYGATQEVDGKTFFMPPATATAGLLAFPQLLVSTFPPSNVSFIDRGLVQIGSQSMHRITLEEMAFPGEASTNSQDVDVIDLYFDPSTNLLLKSAAAVQLSSADPERYLIVVTYSNYQKVQEGLIPCTISQTLNGEPQWILQLQSPNLQPSVDSSYFTF